MGDKKTTSYPKEKIKILLLENISEAAVKRFKEEGYSSIKTINGSLTVKQLLNEIKDVHVLGIRSKTNITEEILSHAKKLQSIGCFCIGINQVDINAATKKGIAVFNAPYSNTRSVAELVIGSSIMLIRRIPDKNNAAHKGVWLKDAKGSFELRGKTLGIIGYGNIGSQVSVLAESLGMKVIYYDIETRLPLGNAESRSSSKDVFLNSDIVTLHVPELPTTKNMVNRSTIKQFKEGAILINYSRGEVVDIEALTKALNEGRLSGAAVDVYPAEPEKNGDAFTSSLQGLSNVLLTPHIGGSTQEAQHSIGEDVSNKLFTFLEQGISIGSHTIPALALPLQEHTHRILHVHNNVPGVLSEINTQLSKHHINILAQYLKTNDQVGYVVLDIDKRLSLNALELLKNVKGTIRVRLVY